MKNLIYVVLGFIIGAVLTYYFCPRPVDLETTETVEAKIIKPKGVISVEKAIELNDNWTKYRKPAVDSAASRQGRKIDKRSTGWAVEDVRNYLDWAEVEANNQGYSMDSLYVYLGVYGEKTSENKRNYTTMFMAPKGQKLTSEASSFSLISLQVPNVEPLNEGNGGSSGYP